MKSMRAPVLWSNNLAVIALVSIFFVGVIAAQQEGVVK